MNIKIKTENEENRKQNKMAHFSPNISQIILNANDLNISIKR